MNHPIVSAQWLNSNLSNENLVILDCTLINQIAKQPIEIQNIQISNARFFDIKGKFSDTQNAFPTAYPPLSQFEKEAQELGINKDSIIVVYDANGIYSSPRVWWLFKSMGHQAIYVLDGGLPEWIKQGLPTVEKSTDKFQKGNFRVKENPKIVRRYNDIFNNLSSKKELVIDVRSEGRFSGEIPEPRAGLRSGQIDNSINLPYTKVLNHGKFQSVEKLKQVFGFLKGEERPIVFSCGSGITACVVYIALEMVNNSPKAVYDGSWTEWGELKKA